MKDEIRTETKDLKDRTKRFALGIIRLFATLPKSPEVQIIGKQLLRAGTSVGANYRETYRSCSKAEFIAKAGDGLKELEETAYWFELLTEGGIIPAAKVEALNKECRELIAIFVSILKKSKANENL
jgi:four helix bundle protein